MNITIKISRELSKTVKMNNARIQKIVTSKDVLEKSTEKLVDFKNRILLNIDYYNSNIFDSSY